MDATATSCEVFLPGLWTSAEGHAVGAGAVFVAGLAGGSWWQHYATKGKERWHFGARRDLIALAPPEDMLMSVEEMEKKRLNQMPDEVRRNAYAPKQIRDMEDSPVLRNLLITQSYHDISEGLTKLLHWSDMQEWNARNCEELVAAGVRVHANWCSIAQWASLNVGAFIRVEMLSPVFRGLLVKNSDFRRSLLAMKAEEWHARTGEKQPFDPSKSTIFDESLEDLREESDEHGHRISEIPHDCGIRDFGRFLLEEISQYMIEGNLKVYHELGPLFAELIHCWEFPSDGAVAETGMTRTPSGTDLRAPEFDDDRFKKLLSELKDGHAATKEEQSGQEFLKKAFEYFRDAVKETDENRKAELMLLFNVYTGFHEQTRLQSAIEGSTNVTMEKLFEKIYGYSYAEERAKREQTTGLLRAHALVRNGLDDAIMYLWKKWSTYLMLALPVPGQTLHLGSTMPNPIGQDTLFPKELNELKHPDFSKVYDVKNGKGVPPEEQQFPFADGPTWSFEEFRSSKTNSDEDARKVGAASWDDFNQRMIYIFALFRSRHFDSNIMGEPFSPAVRQLITFEQKIPAKSALARAAHMLVPVVKLSTWAAAFALLGHGLFLKGK